MKNFPILLSPFSETSVLPGVLPHRKVMLNRSHILGICSGDNMV